MDMVSANAHPASGSMSDEEGQVSLGPLTIFFPDVSFDTFWFTEDLVDVLGVERNSEARAALKAALKGRRAVHLEHEADNVVAHAKGVKAMVEVLVALDSLAVTRPVWSPEAFEKALAAMNAWRRPRPAKYDVRDIVAVPLSGCHPVRFGAAQVAIFSSALWPAFNPCSGAEKPRRPSLFPLRSVRTVHRRAEASARRRRGQTPRLSDRLRHGDPLGRVAYHWSATRVGEGCSRRSHPGAQFDDLEHGLPHDALRRPLGLGRR